MSLRSSQSAGALLFFLALSLSQTCEATQILRLIAKADSRWHTCPIPGSKEWWACWWHSNTHVCGEDRESCCCNGGTAYVDEACVVSDLAMQPCPGDPKPPEPDCSKCADCCRSHWTPSDHDYEPSYHTQGVVKRRPGPRPRPAPEEKPVNKDPVEIPIIEKKEPEEEKAAKPTEKPEDEPTWTTTTTGEEVPVSGEPSTPKPPVKLTPEEIDDQHP